MILQSCTDKERNVLFNPVTAAIRTLHLMGKSIIPRNEPLTGRQLYANIVYRKEYTACNYKLKFISVVSKGKEMERGRYENI